MTSKTWAAGTVIDSPWLQEVNDTVYTIRSTTNILRYIPATEWAAILDGTSTTDLSDYINAAGSTKVRYFPSGTYPIGKPLVYYTQQRWYGDGVASIIKALPALASATIPTITTVTHAVTLDKPPMVYNPTAIDFYNIENLFLNGNSQDVYGVYFVENFHGTHKNLLIASTLGRPYTNIRGQSITHTNCSYYLCGDGVVTYDNTGFIFHGCGFERLASTWFYDQRQPSAFSKGGVRLEDCWFESDSTHRPTSGFLRMSGRRNFVDIHCALDFTATTEEWFRANDTTDTRTVDGLSMGAAACTGADITGNVATGTMLCVIQAGSTNNRIKGAFTASKVTDNGVGNTFDLSSNLATAVQHVTGRFQVRDGGATPSTTAANYVIDCDYNAGTRTIRLLGSTGNTITNPSGNLTWTSALASTFTATSGAMNFNATTNYVFNTTGGALIVPRMTTAQKTALTGINGMVVYDSTLNKFQGYEAGAWTSLI